MDQLVEVEADLLVINKLTINIFRNKNTENKNINSFGNKKKYNIM